MRPWRVSSSWLLRHVAAVAGLGCSACSATNPEAAGASSADRQVRPLSERLAEEAARIPSLLSLNELLIIGVYALSAVLVARGVGSVVHGLWRLGFDTERRLGRWVVFTKLVLGLIVASVMLRDFIEAAPTLSGAALVLFAALAMATLRGSLENLAAGVGLVLRARFKPGDRIVLAEHSGTVREIGLTGVHLRSAEGTTIFLPNRLLHNHALLVTRSENTASVVVTLFNVGDLSPEVVERVRRTALLSPYRSVGTAVRIVLRGDGALEVEIQVQSSLLVGDTKTQLKSALRSAITDGS